MSREIDQKSFQRIVRCGLAGWIGIIACAAGYAFLTSQSRFDEQKLRQTALERDASSSTSRPLHLTSGAIRPSDTLARK